MVGPNLDGLDLLGAQQMATLELEGGVDGAVGVRAGRVGLEGAVQDRELLAQTVEGPLEVRGGRGQGEEALRVRGSALERSRVEAAPGEQRRLQADRGGLAQWGRLDTVAGPQVGAR